ncbi:MAG: hypothetical protein Q9164_004508 [Protoblastenia rupestris]
MSIPGISDPDLWCWISPEWELLRIGLCYGPAWLSIISAFTIYLMSGREIFKKRRELRAFNSSTHEDPWAYFKTTQIAVTSDVLPLTTIAECFDPKPESLAKSSHQSSKSYEQYTVNIASQPVPAGRPSMPPSMMSAQHKKNRAAMEANRAAWGYTKVAILFFISLLVTWVDGLQVPSSANRLFALAHPGRSNVGLTYVAGIVLSLMGFWNSVIYIVTSRAACKALIVSIFARGSAHLHPKEMGTMKSPLGTRRSAQRVSWGDDFERLAGEREPI